MLTNKRFAREVKKLLHSKFHIQILNASQMQKTAVTQDSLTYNNEFQKPNHLFIYLLNNQINIL